MVKNEKVFPPSFSSISMSVTIYADVFQVMCSVTRISLLD